MTNGINTRELILQILLEIEEEGKHSHIAIRNALSKYQFLPRQERAFITRVCEGTLEYRILIDYIIDSYSKVPVDKMKPVIREILRSAVYQIRFMDSVPDSAVCNEAVKRLLQPETFCKRCSSYDCQRVEKSETSFKGRKSGQISVCQIFYAGNTGKPLD